MGPSATVPNMASTALAFLLVVEPVPCQMATADSMNYLNELDGLTVPENTEPDWLPALCEFIDLLGCAFSEHQFNTNIFSGLCVTVMLRLSSDSTHDRGCRTLIGMRVANSTTLHASIALLLVANIANPHPAAPEGRLIAGESGVSRIDIETMVFRVPRTDPIATAVAPWLVHHPGYSVNAERETVFREEPTPDRGDPINAIQDAPDGTHRDKSIADLKGV